MGGSPTPASPTNIPVSRGTYDTAGNAVTLTPEQEQIRNAGLSEEAKKGMAFQAAKDSYNKQYEGQQLEQASTAFSNADAPSQNAFGRDATKSAYQAMTGLDK